MGAQQQVLDGRRTILEQIAELFAVRRLKVAADRDAQRRIGQHLTVGQGGSQG